MTFTFDKNLSTERSLEMSAYTEHIINGSLSASNITDDAPEFEPFTNDTFTTLEVTPNISLVGTYNHFVNLSVSYNDEEGKYFMNLNIDRVQ